MLIYEEEVEQLGWPTTKQPSVSLLQNMHSSDSYFPWGSVVVCGSRWKP